MIREPDREREWQRHGATGGEGEAGGVGGRFAEQARETGQRAAEAVTEHSRGFADRQKQRTARRLEHVCHALEEAARHLHEEEDHTVAEFTESVAERVEDFADYLRRRSIEDLVNDIADMGRSRPQMFIGGLFIIGLAASRFLSLKKSSATSPRPGEQYHPAATGPPRPQPGAGHDPLKRAGGRSDRPPGASDGPASEEFPDPAPRGPAARKPLHDPDAPPGSPGHSHPEERP